MATPPPPGAAPAATPNPAAATHQTVDPQPTQPPSSPATTTPRFSPTQQQVEDSPSARSEEQLSWSSDDEEDEVVPDSLVAEVPQQEMSPQSADPGAPGRGVPHQPGEKAGGTGIQGRSEGLFKLRSEVVVPEGLTREPNLGRAGHSHQPRQSYRDVLLRQRSLDGQGEGRRPLGRDGPSAPASRRDEPPRHGSEESEEGWQFVRPRRRRSRPAPLANSMPGRLQERRAIYLSKMRGRCFNCLARDHRVARCRDPTKCWLCFRSGHISSRCPTLKSENPPNKLQRHIRQPHPTSTATTNKPPSAHFPSQQHQAISNQPATMAELDLSNRPEQDFLSMPFTTELRDRVMFLEARTLIVWIGRNRPYTEEAHVAEAFMHQFNIDRINIQVSRHNPADFLVTISDRDAFEEATRRDSFTYGGRQFRLRRWSPLDQANRAVMRYHVRLCLEGIPMHMWTEDFVAWIISRSCSFHYAEEHSRRREATDVFELLAWTADPRSIPLRVWLTVTDPDHNSQTTPLDAPLPLVYIHRQRPTVPIRGMVYEVLFHLVSVEDMRIPGPDGRPRFYPLYWNRGVADAAQVVAPAPAPPEQMPAAAPGAAPAPALVPAPARHSCAADIWTWQRRDDDDHGDDDGQNAAPRRRSLFQRLRWPTEKERHRERSPRRHHGEGSRRGGRHHDHERSLSPATRRSRERSLEREAHRVFRRVHREPTPAASRRQSGRCREAGLSRHEGPDADAAGAVARAQPVANEVGVSLVLNREQPTTHTAGIDPMLLEAQLQQTYTSASATEVEQELVLTAQAENANPAGGGQMGFEPELPPTEEVVAATQETPQDAEVQDQATTSLACQLTTFLNTVTQPAVPPIINTPAMKKRVTPSAKEGTIRRSGRIAEKMKTKGVKTAEELAQDLLLQKLHLAASEEGKKEEARARLTQLFDGPLSLEAMAAIEDLHKAMNLDTKKPKKAINKKRVAPVPA